MKCLLFWPFNVWMRQHFVHAESSMHLLQLQHRLERAWTYHKIIRWHHVSIFLGTGKERGYRTLCRSLCQARARTLYRILARPHSLALALVLCHTHADAHNLAQPRPIFITYHHCNGCLRKFEQEPIDGSSAVVKHLLRLWFRLWFRLVVTFRTACYPPLQTVLILQ